MTIGKLTRASAQACKDIEKLLAALRVNSKEYKAPLSDLRRIVGDKNVVMMVVKDKGHIVGMATLYMFTRLGKRVGLIEDVVVDAVYRGQGLGEKLMRALIAVARKGKLKSIALTSRPERIAANKLYQKVGFEIKKTNPYRMSL